MKRFSERHKSGVVTAMCGALLLIGLCVGVSTQSPVAAGPGATPFLQAGHCYRFVFSVEGAPAWKVLEVLDGGWIKAEVDTGPASAQREPAWVNTGQIVTVRETRCSD
jgi:hypothetical protein